MNADVPWTWTFSGVRPSHPVSKSSRLSAAAVLAGLLVVAAPAAAQQGGSEGAVTTPPASPESVSRSVTRAGTKVGDINIDGRLDDAAWAAAPVTSGFIQSEPDEGLPGSRDTEVRILFDDDAMYVAARMWDHPDSITRQLLRRDEHGPFMD